MSSEIKEDKIIRAGYIAIIGEPNVGKSTLMNALVGQKLSIVSSKPQTTRRRVLGIKTVDECQMIFFDTPGILKPRYLLHDVMMSYVEHAMSDADILLVLVDSTRPRIKRIPPEVREKLERLQTALFLVLNKIDKVKKAELLPLIDNYQKEFPWKEIVPVSALTGEGIELLSKLVQQYLPMHPPYFPPDAVSEHPERFFVGEIIREKIFEKFSEEIPYSVEVEIVDYKERENGKYFISAEITVERQSQKGMVIGKKGEALKVIGELARHDIEKFVEHQVFLELHVRVREKWRSSETLLKRMGYSTE